MPFVVVSLAATLTSLLVAPVPVAGPVPEHHIFALLRDYFPSGEIAMKQGERIRFVDTDPTAGPGHSFTETVPEGVTPKFDSDIVPPGTFRDVSNVESLPPGTYKFNCKIHNSLKGTLTVG
jgi:hypothetical protein